MRDNFVIVSRFQRRLFDGPADGVAQTFSQHGSTGFADGRQLAQSPFLRTGLLELAHEQLAYSLIAPKT